MKSLTILIISLLFAIVFNTNAQEILTNQNVLMLVQKGLPSSVIVSKIKSTKNSFDVSIDTLIKLKESQIPDDVINAMVEATQDQSKYAVAVDLNNPLNPHESGIYYLKKNGDKTGMVQLEPSVYSQTKSGGALAYGLTYGLASITQNITLNGRIAQMQFEDNEPVFYFYFESSRQSLNQTGNWWFSVATSPNEFLLVHLNERTKSREVEIGSVNVLESTSGVSDKNKTAFKFVKIAPGIYKVYFEQQLSGEYCFMYAGVSPQGSVTINKVYDFGINKGKDNSGNGANYKQEKRIY